MVEIQRSSFKIRPDQVEKFFKDVKEIKKFSEGDFARSGNRATFVVHLVRRARMRQAQVMAATGDVKGALNELAKLDNDLKYLAESDEFKELVATSASCRKRSLVDEFRGPALQTMRQKDLPCARLQMGG